MTRRNRTVTDLSFLAFVCAFLVAVQFHDHKLWFQQEDPYAVASSGEEASPKSEVDHSRLIDNRRGSVPARGTHSTKRHSVRPDARPLVSTPINTSRLVSRGALHSSPGGRVEREHRERLLRRNAIPDRDVAVGGWSVVAASCVAARAVVSGVPCLGSGFGAGR